MIGLSFTISLRVFHPTAATDSIENKLGMKAKISRSVGDPRVTPKGKPLDGTNKETYCSFTLIDKQPGDFVDGLCQVIPNLIPYEEYFEGIAQEGGRVEFYVGVFTDVSTGFSLNRQVITSLEKLHLQLSVEIYY